MNQHPPPGYGYGPPPKKGVSAGVWIAIVCVAGAGIVGLMVLGTREQKREWAAEDAVVVTADEMVATYKGNEIAGDEKFKGKKIQITGEVDRIDSDLADDPVVMLAAKDSLLGVRLEGLSKAAAAKLAKGSKVTLLCKGAGEILGSPRLEGCTVPDHAEAAAAATSPLVASADAEPLIKRSKRVTDAKLKKHGLSWDGIPTAPEIVSAYLTNELAADKRFKNPTALAGQMRAVSKHDNGKVTMTLGATNETTGQMLGSHVLLFLDTEDGTTLDVATDTKPGQTVLVVCDSGRGSGDSFITFGGCSIWAGSGKPTAAASASGSAPPPASTGTHIDLSAP